MSVYHLETFEALNSGALGNQGLWGPQEGGAKPRIDVVAGSVVDGTKSISQVDAGGGAAAAYVEYVLADALTTGQPYHISWRVLVTDGATDSGFEVDLLAGDVATGPWDNWSAGFIFKEGTGGQADLAVVTIYDELNPAGVTFSTGVAVDTKFTFHLIIESDGTYNCWTDPGGVLSNIAPNRQLFSGMESITEYAISHDGVVPTAPVNFDTFTFDYGAEGTADVLVTPANADAQQGHNAAGTGDVSVTASNAAAQQGHNAAGTGSVTVTPANAAAQQGHNAAGTASLSVTVASAIGVGAEVNGEPGAGDLRQDVYFASGSKQEIAFGGA